MTELTMHHTRISGQEWSGFKPGPAPTVSAPIEVEETTFVPVGEVERLKKAVLEARAMVWPMELTDRVTAVFRILDAALSKPQP